MERILGHLIYFCLLLAGNYYVITWAYTSTEPKLRSFIAVIVSIFAFLAVTTIVLAMWIAVELQEEKQRDSTSEKMQTTQNAQPSETSITLPKGKE